MMDIERIKIVIRHHFPGNPEIVTGTLAGMATLATLLLADLPHCIGLNLVGPPSSHKTTVLDFFEGLPFTYRTDHFSPHSFVSHYAGTPRKKLAPIDLLPKIKHKCVLISELAPTLNARREELMDNIAILTKVFDGRGLLTDSAVHGRRGYEGDYRFCWLGATTSIPHRTWQAMGKLGSRWVFLNMQGQGKTEEELAEMLMMGNYREKIADCQGVVTSFMQELWQENHGFGGLNWHRGQREDVLLRHIGKLARRTARWRGITQTEEEGGYNPPEVEEPERLMATFDCIARGNAIINGRAKLMSQDIDLVTKIADSSMPEDRRRIFQALQNHQRLNSDEVQGLIQCSRPTAINVMEKLKSLGLTSLEKHGSSYQIELA